MVGVHAPQKHPSLVNLNEGKSLKLAMIFELIDRSSDVRGELVFSIRRLV
jgi:hypothetical protein